MARGGLTRLSFFLALSFAFFALSLAQSDDFAPPPPSIGADIPVTYFGPSPSQVQKELVGPYTLIKSGTLDTEAGTITLPLYRGTLEGNPNYNIWYVVTDSSDQANAAALGINFSSKLAFANYGRATRVARLSSDGSLIFRSGTVNFAPARTIVPGAAPNYFPPTSFAPGSIGDADYSPLVRVQSSSSYVYNAPIVAGNFTAGSFPTEWCTKDINTLSQAAQLQARTQLHDKVVRFCPPSGGNVGTVTVSLTAGFSFAKPVLYLSLDANDFLPAAMEAATLAPGLKDVVIGRDDSLFSAVERLFTITNGYHNGDVNNAKRPNPPANEVNHPGRQGFNSALRDGLSPLNVLGGIPTVATDYSPLWDLNVGSWTEYAIANGYRERMREEFQYLGYVARGYITAPGGGEFGSSGFIVNCPVVHRFL